MSMKKIVTSVCSTQPFRGLIGAIAKSRRGRSILSGMSPR
jgi:hypothetical protein